MDVKQKLAIDKLKSELVETLKYLVVQLMCQCQIDGILRLEEREAIEKCHYFSSDRLLVLIELLKRKDRGWAVLTRFLTNSNCGSLSDRLMVESGVEEVTLPLSPPLPPDLVEFLVDVAQFYQKKLGRCSCAAAHLTPHSLSQVWVAPVFEGSWKGRLVRAGGTQLLCAVAECRDADATLIAGHPGSGKTALMHKWAVEWADEYLLDTHSSTGLFTCVLLVPLRFARPADSFLHLAVDYHLRQHRCGGLDADRLLALLSQLGSSLILCLDGLNELPRLDRSPFRSIFARPFDHSAQLQCRSPVPPHSEFKLVVSGRPYALLKIDRTFSTVEWRILPLEGVNIVRFLQLHFEATGGAEQSALATKVLSWDPEVTPPVPLLLTLIVGAAAHFNGVTNLTRLYCRMIRQRFTMETRQGKLVKGLDVSCWQQSWAFQSVCQLAFDGIMRRKRKFSSMDLWQFRVPNDIFTVGLLLYGYDSSYGGSVEATFVHQSLLEFCAAAQTASLSEVDLAGWLSIVKTKIVCGGGEFGRFLFGLSSSSGNCRRLFNCLQIGFNDCPDHLGVDGFLLRLSNALLDVQTDEESAHFGLTLAASVHLIGEGMVTVGRDEIWWNCGSLLSTQITQVHPSISSGLQLRLVKKGGRADEKDWWIRGEGNSAQLAVISGTPEVSYEWQSATTMVWLIDDDVVDYHLSSSSTTLPSAVDQLVVRTRLPSQMEVILRLNTNSSDFRPKLLSFACSQMGLPNWRMAVRSHFDTKVAVVHRKISSEQILIVWATAEFSSTLSWPLTIESLLYSVVKLLAEDPFCCIKK